MDKAYKGLEQFDNESGEDLGYLPVRYGKKVGVFLINFSFLEHTLNLIIADMISDRSHDLGYRILGPLSMRNKIDFFHGILLNYISTTGQNKKTELKEFKKRLENINDFRNKIAHANWSTIKKDGTLRTKIVTDNDNGFIKFEYVKITPKSIQLMIEELFDLTEGVDEFFMDLRNAGAISKVALGKAFEALISAGLITKDKVAAARAAAGM